MEVVLHNSNISKVDTVYKIEEAGKFNAERGFPYRVVKYYRMENEADDFLYVVYSGTEQQCKDWLKTSWHQGKLEI